MNLRTKKMAFWGVRLSEKQVYKFWLKQQWQSWMTLSSVILQNWPPYIFCLMYLFVNNWQVQKVFQSSHICDSSAAGTTYCNALKICDFLFFEWVQYLIKLSKIIIFQSDPSPIIAWAGYRTPKKIPIQNFLVFGHFPCSYGKKTH